MMMSGIVPARGTYAVIAGWGGSMFTRFRITLAGLSVLFFTPVAVAQDVAEYTETEAAADDFGPMIRQQSDRLQWTATADALFLGRSAAGGQQLLFEPHTATELLDATDLTFPFSAGPRLSLRCEDAAGWGVEVTYFGIDGWCSEAGFPASSFPFGVGYLSIDNTITVPVNMPSSSTAPGFTVRGGRRAVCVERLAHALGRLPLGRFRGLI